MIKTNNANNSTSGGYFVTGIIADPLKVADFRNLEV